MNKKAKSTSMQLTADNALELIFHEYSGNPIKKAIDYALEKNRNNQPVSDGQLSDLEIEHKHMKSLKI